jgi:putative oxidoreductase
MRALTAGEPLHLDFGLLLLRLGVGGSLLIFHGWDKLGANMANLGVQVWPTAWGFAAACAESLGSFLLILGLWTRPAAALIACTLFVAVLRHLNLPPEAAGAGWQGASHALELLAAALCVFFAGPGKLSLSPR